MCTAPQRTATHRNARTHARTHARTRSGSWAVRQSGTGCRFARKAGQHAVHPLLLINRRESAPSHRTGCACIMSTSGVLNNVIGADGIIHSPKRVSPKSRSNTCRGPSGCWTRGERANQVRRAKMPAVMDHDEHDGIKDVRYRPLRPRRVSARDHLHLHTEHRTHGRHDGGCNGPPLRLDQTQQAAPGGVAPTLNHWG